MTMTDVPKQNILDNIPKYGCHVLHILEEDDHSASVSINDFMIAAKVRLLVFICLLLAVPLSFADSVSLVRVEKSERKMFLEANGQILKSYDISLGDEPEGHKTQEGDERTPEGHYMLNWRNPQSSYYLTIHISYPNDQDKAQAASRGVSPGGDIFIHGLPNGMGALGKMFTGRDWTDGCIAVNDNNQMQEIWDLVPNGTPIIINS